MAGQDDQPLSLPITHTFQAILDRDHDGDQDGNGDDGARLRHPTQGVSTTVAVRSNRSSRSRRRPRGSSSSSRSSSSSSSSPPAGPHTHSGSGWSRSRPDATATHTAAATKAELKTDIRILFLLVALVSLAWSLYQLPLNRVIERRLCVEYYRDHEPSASAFGGLESSSWRAGEDGNGSRDEIPEEMCKVDQVQQGLGRIQGFMETGWVVGGMFLPFFSSPRRCLSSVYLPSRAFFIRDKVKKTISRVCEKDLLPRYHDKC